MIKPWEEYIAPYRLYGNLYFAGSRCGSSHLVDSNDGLILIDSGYPQTLYLLLENIRALGFKPENIRHIIHSHGHYDHLGATRQLIEMYHPRTYLGAPDFDYATGVRDLTFARELGYTYIENFMPDVLINDGDVMNIGGIDFCFLATPGHTEGTVSIFFDVVGEYGIKRAGMFGGAGLNSLQLNFLDRHGLPHSLREDFLHSLDRMENEHVDIHVGNHIKQNHMYEKLERLRNGEKNPFIDPGEWRCFIDECRAAYRGMLRNEATKMK